MISTVICKPTKDCNADCSYCSSPPDQMSHWTFEDFKIAFDALIPRFSSNPVWIWHGGEPMLLGPEFYEKCWEYTRSKYPGVRFSIQTNILLYTSKKWKRVLRDIFKGSISTSFDMNSTERTLKGCPDRYEKRFKEKLDLMLEDGFAPLVISTYDESNIGYATEAYDFSMNHDISRFDIRLNYRYPLGRAAGERKELISPKSYGEMLVETYNKWVVDNPGFIILPLKQMVESCIGKIIEQCPWTRTCAGGFIGIEPNGDIYNCSDFADIGDKSYRFGNVFQNVVDTKTANFVRRVDKEKFISEALRSPAAVQHKRRRVKLPVDCTQCRHYKECNGGCLRDVVLYDRELGGKFYYCQSWMMVYDRIKESILSGEADNILKMLGHDIDESKRHVKTYMNRA